MADTGLDGCAALAGAAQNGDLAGVRAALAGGADVDATDAAGSAALHYASCFGHADVVDALLAAGARPDVQDAHEWTPLMWAVNNNHLGIVRALLAAGADLHARASSGRTAAELAGRGSSTFDWLRANGHIRSDDDASTRTSVENALVDLDGPEEQRLERRNSGLNGQAEPPTNEEPAPALVGSLYTPAAEPAAFEPVLARAPSPEPVDLGALAGDVSEPLFGTDPVVIEPAFDWTTFKVRDSLAMPPDAAPALLDAAVSEFAPQLQSPAPASASTVFLAWRYAFYCGTEHAFHDLASATVRRFELRLAEPSRARDVSFLAYWLANAQVLLYFVRRDRGLAEATQREFQPALEQLVRLATQCVRDACLQLLEPLLDACILDYDSIPEYGSVQYRDEWKLFKNKRKDDRQDVAQKHMLPPTPENLIKRPGPARVTSILSSVLLIFRTFGVHAETQLQILAKLLYHLGAHTQNAIAGGHKRYLNRRRAMQIRLNVSLVEDWCRNSNFRPPSVDLAGKTFRFKSLVETGATFLRPLTTLLAWLQTFTAFVGTDANALAEFPTASAPLLLHASLHYRYELGEKRLSKEARHALQSAAREAENRSVTAQLERAALDERPDSGIESSYILLKFELPVQEQVSQEPYLELPDHVPGLAESLGFWGQPEATGLAAEQGARYLVPTGASSITDKLHIEEPRAADAEKTGGVVDVPAVATHKPLDGEEMFEENPWAVW